MTSDSARNNALLTAQLASLSVDSDGNYIPTPAEPGVARIDYATDNTGLQTGDIGQFGYTDDLSPVIGGYQAEATGDLVIRIVCNAEFIGTALIGPDGHWSFTPPTPLEPNHEYIFTTIIQDSATDALLVSLPYRFYTTDVNGDLKPDVSIDKVTDAVKGANNATGALHHGDVTNDARPALSGHATANARVNIYDNGELIGSTTASSKGAWSYTPGTLSDGDHYLSASVYTAAGESHRSASFGITVDTHAETPVITEVYDDKGLHTGPVALGGATDDSQPKVSGTAEAGSTVTVMVHSATLNHTYTLGSVVADAHGRWSYQLHGGQNINATKGDWTFLAQSVDVAGNQSPMSSGYIVEAVASNADVSATPEITYIVDDVGLHTGNIADGGKTDDKQPGLHGTGEPYSTVVITMDGPVTQSTHNIATLTVGKDGTWSYQFKGGQKLQSGNNVFHITATDGDGHKVTGHTYTVDLVGSNQDTDGPDVPTIDKYHDNAGASSGDFKSGTTTDDTTPTLYGHADAKSVVKIYEGSTLLGSVTADKDGEWNFTPSERSEGKHTFFATATDAAGHTSGHSGNFVVTIDVPDTTPPDAPVITEVYDDVGTHKGPVANGGKTDDSQPLISGTAEKNSVVTVKVHSAAGHDYTLGSVVTDNAGHWSYQLHGGQDITNGLGDWTFTAQAKDAAGNKSGWSAGYTVETVGSNQDDTTAPDTPVITAAIETYDNGHTTGVTNGDTIDDNTPELIGDAAAGSVVTIYDGAVVIGSVTADSKGTWFYDIARALADGRHTFTVTATNAAGNTSSHSGEFVLNVDAYVPDTTPPDAPVITDYYDDVGDSKGHESNGSTTDDTTPTLNGQAEANSIVKVYEGSTLLGSTTAHGDGTWSFTPSARSEGKHTFFATATDAAGNTSTHSSDFVVDVETAPVLPAFGYYEDNYQAYNTLHGGNGTGYAFFNDATPTLHGTGKADSVVNIYRESYAKPNHVLTCVGSAQADASGNWSFTDSVTRGAHYSWRIVPLDHAGHEINEGATVTPDLWIADEQDTNYSTSGNLGDLLTPPEFNYFEDNYQAYNTLHGSNGTGFALFNDATPTLHGTGQADSVVNIYRESYAHSNYVLTCVGSAQADASGNWSFTDSVTRSAHYSWRIVPLDHAGHEINEGATVTPDLWIADEQDTNYSTSGNLGDLLTPPEFNYFEDNYQAYNTLHGSNGTGFALFNDATPTLHGTGQADSVVNIYRESIAYPNHVLTCVGSAQADASGNWSFTDSVTRGAYYSWRIVPLDHAGHEINEGATVTPDLLIADEQDTNYSTSGNPGDLLTTTQHEAAALLATTSDLQADHAVINLHNNAVQTLYLTLNDILSEAHPNLFIQDGHQQLAVTGDQGDVVELKVNDLSHNTWQDSGAVTAGGIQYEVYQHAGSDVELLVQHGLELHQVS